MLARRALMAAASVVYTANAVRLDGVNDSLTRDADLIGVADGKQGLFSCWLNMKGGDGTRVQILSEDGLFFEVERQADDTIRIRGFNSAASNILTLVSTSTFVAAGVWFHVLGSWNLATPVAQLFITDVDDEASSVETDDTIDYARGVDWGVGARSSDASQKIDADFADLYFNIATSLDLTVVANRRKFINSALKPVDLGTDGSRPTGTAPIIFLSGPTATWHTNDGSGGGFTENGALTDGTDSPSD